MEHAYYLGLNGRELRSYHKRGPKDRQNMIANFLKMNLTDSVHKAQEHYFGNSQSLVGDPGRDAFSSRRKKT